MKMETRRPINEEREMPFDAKVYRYSDGQPELAHATGYEVLDDFGIWRDEYVDSDGEYHY